MFQKACALLICVSIYSGVVCGNNCSEYTLIIKEDKCSSHDPTTLSLPHYPKSDALNCSNNVNYIHSAGERNGNESCVIVLSYQSFNTKCEDIKAVNVIKTDVANANTTHICKSGDDKSACNEEKPNLPKNEFIDKTMDTINLIYANENIRNSLELVYNKWEDLNFVTQCTFSDDIICLDENDLKKEGKDVVEKDSHNIFGNTLIILIDDNASTEAKYNNYTKNASVKFDCSIPFNGAQIIQDQYITLTYNILRKYKCESNNAKQGKNITNSLTALNVYFHKKYIHNNTKVENVKCMNHFKTVNNHILSLDCNEAIRTHNDTLTNKHEADLNKSLIWYCGFKNPGRHDVLPTAHTSKQHYDFRNCAQDQRNLNKTGSLTNSDIILILKKDAVIANETSAHEHLKDFSSLISKDNLNLHLMYSNQSDCNKAMQLNISNGNIINAWAEDEEQFIRELNDTSLIKLKILNCMYTTKATESNRDDNKPLELNIVIYKPNNTVLNKSILNDFYKIKTNTTKIVILDCVHSNSEDAKNISTADNTKVLVLECIFTDLDDINKIDIETTSKPNTLPTTTAKPEKKFEQMQLDTSSEEPNTESNTQTYQSGMERRSKPNDSGPPLDPIVYVFIGLVTITTISAIAIFALKKLKAPISYHLTSTRDWPVTQDNPYQ